jgi:ubiquitin C-terminal hydrolase
MNATLQCLLHVNELVAYFLNEYPKDFKKLQEKNKYISTKGNISKVFYELIKGVYSKNKEIYIPDNSSDLSYENVYDYSNSISPEKFHKTIGYFNSQFKNLEANDSKDLILYLLQTIHSELNYLSDNQTISGRPNQYDRQQLFSYFCQTYEKKNFSIISTIFYGTYENLTKCSNCSRILYNFQKFEFISFGMYDYVGKIFNIYNGFEDNQKEQTLSGDNKFFCNNCKQLCEAKICTKILMPPNKLLINIDFGKNKIYHPKKVTFDQEIDITKYISYDYGMQFKYRIIGVCLHYGLSGSSGHYVALIKHKNNGKWYCFNDSFVSEYTKRNINDGTPYLLLYERIK